MHLVGSHGHGGLHGSWLDAEAKARYECAMDRWARQRLEDLKAAGLFRDPEDARARLAGAPDGGRWIDACSNDYLGLGAHLVSRETMDSIGRAAPGAGASRLVQGTLPEHEALEAELANWLGTEACLTLPSAFAANVGLIPALASEPDALVVSDALNHASIVDGCRLARGRVVVTPHLRVEAVEAALAQRSASAPAWVVTEGLFSMDGDVPDLAALRGVCDRFEAGLIVDEAHSLGVLGEHGSGAAQAQGAKPDLVVAGLGKAVGAQGGLVASSVTLRSLLWNRARSFVFSTGISPMLAQLVREQVRATRAADVARVRLLENSVQLRAELSRCNIQLGAGAVGPIVPVLLGSNERALAAMAELRRRGVLAQAIRPPTVPVGSARLRLTVHADWPSDAVARIAEGVVAACA